MNGVWWDWRSITSVDVILISIIMTLLLAFIGFGCVQLLKLKRNRKNDYFSNFDFLQKINFYFLFGFLLLFFFVFIFSFVNLPFFASVILILSIAALGLVSIRGEIVIHRLSIRAFLRNYSFMLISLVLLLVIVALSSSLITGRFGTPNMDGGDHTFFTRLVLDNPNVLWTHSAKPYSDTLLQYPLGTHVLSAFLVISLQIPIQKIIIILTVIMPAFISLSIYSTIKCLFGSRVMAFIGLLIAGFFSVGSILGPVWWTGLPLLLSLYISISGLGLFFIFIKSEVGKFQAFIVGIMLFVASQTYPVSFLILSLWLAFLLCFKLVENHGTFSLKDLFCKKNAFIGLAFLGPVLLMVPSFYFNFAYTIQSGSYLNPTVVTSWSVTTIHDRIFFNWLNLMEQSNFFSGFGIIFVLTPFSIFAVFTLIIPKIHKKLLKVMNLDKFYSSLALIYLFMFLVIGYLALSLLPVPALLAFMNPERIWSHIYIFSAVLTTVGVYFLATVFYSFLKGISWSQTKVRKVFYGSLAISFILIAFIASVPLVTEQLDSYDTVRLSFNRDTINPPDLFLMTWITHNTDANCRILISQEDSGQFVSAVTLRRTVEFGNFSVNYENLMHILTLNASDPQAIPLLIGFSINYVYIGSTAMNYDVPRYIYRQFNFTQMVSTPYFILEKQYDNASLFYFNATIASTIYAAVNQAA
jgi:hypothetical protein